MIRSADELQPDDDLHADVCIVGAGAAGITLALELARLAPSLRVLLLDGGTDPRRNTSPPPSRVSPSQFLYRGQIEGDMNIFRPLFLTETRSRSYGGSTNCWGGWCRPLDRIDFEGHGQYEGWPITRDELVPFYERAQEICFLDRFEYDNPRYWIDRAALNDVKLGTIPDQHGDALRTVCFQGIRMEKWSFFDDYRDRLKSTPGIEVVLNANLLRIETGDDDRVTQLRLAALDADGKPGVAFTATAVRFVLALGGIETVRALLFSPTPRQPNGLGNNRDLVGRFFNIHPVVTDAAEVRFGTSGWTQPVRDFYAQETNFYAETRLHAEAANASPPAVVRGQEVQPYEAHAVSAQLEAGRRAEPGAYTRVWATLAPTADALGDEGVGNFRVILRGWLDRATLDVNWEQTSEYRNRVTLAKGDLDVLGLPKARLEWYIHDPDIRTYERALMLAEKKLQAAGYLKDGSFQRLFDMRDRKSWGKNLPNPGDHHMGGTRMASDPARGVVNADARLHDVPNLYVSSCSVWPSGGWANPTLPIVAMAARLAHHLAIDEGAGHAVRIDQATLPNLQPAEGAG